MLPSSTARPSAHSFLPELADSSVHQVSIETAQSGLDYSVLKTLPGKTIILGTLDLSDMGIEAPETVAARIRRALPHVWSNTSTQVDARQVLTLQFVHFAVRREDNLARSEQYRADDRIPTRAGRNNSTYLWTIP
jgi:hypothetical protein